MVVKMNFVTSYTLAIISLVPWPSHLSVCRLQY